MKNQYYSVDLNTIGIIINYKDQLLVCLIDANDFDVVNLFNTTWNITKNKGGHIDGVRTKVQKDKKRVQIWMHNLILNKRILTNVIDHINHNTLDNRKINLREVTSLENPLGVIAHLRKLLKLQIKNEKKYLNLLMKSMRKLEYTKLPVYGQVPTIFKDISK